MEKTQATKINCDMCGAVWLGHFYNQPLCNDCRAQQLSEDDVEGVGDEKLGNNGEPEVNGENNDID